MILVRQLHAHFADVVHRLLERGEEPVHVLFVRIDAVAAPVLRLDVERPAVLVVLYHLYLVETYLAGLLHRRSYIQRGQFLYLPVFQPGQRYLLAGEIAVVGPESQCPVRIEEPYLLEALFTQGSFDAALVHSRHLVVHFRRSTGRQNHIRRFRGFVPNHNDGFLVLVRMAGYLVRYGMVFRKFRPHVGGLSPVADGGVFNLLAAFRLAYHFKGVIHVAFDGGHHERILLKFPVPVFHRLQTLFRQSCRQAEFQHLDAGSHFHNQPFLFQCVLRGCHAVFHHHAFTCQTLLVTGGADNLPKGFLYIIVIVFEIPLPGHIDGILVRFVMGHSAAVVTDGDKAVFHLQQKIIEADMQLPVVCFRIAPFRHTAVLP